MAFELSIPTPLSPDATAARLWDARRHTATIPLTRLDTDQRLDREGLRFTARTGIGRFAVDDHMDVLAADGGRVVIKKTGRFHRGVIEATVEPDPQGAIIRWYEDLQIRWLSLFAQPLVDAVAAVAYRRSIHDILASDDPEA